MNPRNAARQKLLALQRRVRDPQLLDRLAVIPAFLQRQGQAHGQGRPAQSGEAIDLLEVGDRHDPRHDRDPDPRLARPPDEIEVEGVVEKELGDQEIHPLIHLGLEVREIACAVGTLEVAFRICGRADTEIRPLATDESHELGRVVEGARAVRLRSGLSVTPDRQHVLDPRRSDAPDDARELLLGMPDAAEVGHRIDARLRLDEGSDLEGSQPAAPARTVGHRHETRLKIGQLADGAQERGDPLLRFGREELEGEARLRASQALGDAHPQSLIIAFCTSLLAGKPVRSYIVASMSASAPRLIKACRGEPTDATPVWFMRQAGRFLPEYRALRAKMDLLTMVQTPEVAAEVTLQPVRRLGVDAAIVFADILLPLLPMGVSFHFAQGEGPVFDEPLRGLADIEKLRVDVGDRLDYVGRTLELVAKELPKDVALIGFAGAPFTLAAYLIEGGHSRNFARVKELMWRDETAWRLLMEKLAEVCVAYLRMQLAHGAQVVQLFDSWVGCLSPEDYARYVLPYSAAILGGLRREGHLSIHFGTDTATLLPLMAKASASVLGVDWRLPIDLARGVLPKGMPVQGNLDPLVLLAPPDVALESVRRTLRAAEGGPHIFNTGHGLVPETPPDLVKRVVDLVHEESKNVSSG
jgi:uroporphyrinogen decarboxylase